CSKKPESSGPREAIAPPSADHSAIDFVRPGPVHRAVISASVVGYAIPAAMPPPSRATKRTTSEGEYAASRDIGIASAVPRTSIVLRPYRSPSAPSHSTEHARPSE